MSRMTMTSTMTVAPERPDVAPDGFPTIDPLFPQPDRPDEPFPEPDRPDQPFPPQPQPDPLPDRPPMPEPPTDPFPTI